MTPHKRTPLYLAHGRAEAKLIDFGGWEMPVQYAGILEEHRTVRRKAGLFDVSHMGEVDVQGPQALELVNMLITNNAARLAPGQILYSPMCTENGGIIDDILVYCYSHEHFLLVVNAANTDKDFAWIKQLAGNYSVKVENISAKLAQLAVQGPLAEKILQPLTTLNLAQLKYYWFGHGKVAGVDCLISRTGYTGEDGFELYAAPETAMKLWEDLLTAGKREGLQPIGLGARDTLRLEACLPLYGNELTEQITPLEAGLGNYVKLDKQDFLGKLALAAQTAEGVPRALVGFEMIDRGVARSHYPLAIGGREIGFVTSGSFAPTLDKSVGLGLIETNQAESGKEIAVVVRGKGLKAKIIPKPFYKRQQAKKTHTLAGR
ncbi:MAG TPA: glycine cleavage system aminomethyltransferase GcvT [Desulfobacteria bacterium]|nr:glycine cleavage system aminomethyltransferase GcvT [Desulfobacteria bacterium]